ncbi:hypothetical protein QYM36_000418 [Artemia franciscana]|uniref:Carnosine N-methyltransferase n=1 Tax=Artemia franciscana TaxID=6661 RepID=A0AA88IQL3_ARTSF|nr:hypothetical protein QYM36_000418 [Artemia franciscana]
MDNGKISCSNNLQKILGDLSSVRTHSLMRLARTEKYLSTLPKLHQNLLASYKKHLVNLRVGIEQNADIIKLISADVSTMFENIQHDSNFVKANTIPTAHDMEKVQMTIKAISRDWSADGEKERELCYQPILDELARWFPLSENSSDVEVLVPGAGLGRLAYEIAKRGYTCQGNEFSLFMLFASNFVLNKCQGLNHYRLFPWVHTYTNNVKDEDQMRPSFFPDADPSELPPNARFSMAAGDFLEIYTEKETWNCVATCFFVDCAHNIVSFIETIWNILKPGGIWINLGPLLYHFADIPGEKSIEPSYTAVREAITGFGFTFEKEELGVKTTYCQNPSSMLQYEYNSVFFVCRKPVDAPVVNSMAFHTIR